MAEPTHPLDPLSTQEIRDAASIIAATGNVNPTTRATSIGLKQPNKRHVIDWVEGDPMDRRALAILRTDGETYEAVVDLTAMTLESWELIPGAQPAIRSSEWDMAQRLVKDDPRWRAAMQARGYVDFENIFCESLSAGFFGTEEEKGRRLLKMPCYDIAGTRINIYARPIEGVIATVDLDAGEVIDVLDEGVVPVGRDTHEFDEGSVAPLRDPRQPVRNAAAAGWSFAIEERVVSWQGWSFHLGFNQRFGPILSLVAHEDGNQTRSVLYQGHISEIFVPYMDPATSWAFRTYLDGGEYGLGALSSPLAPGIDCPENALFIDATLSTPTGGAYRRERVICVFERDTGAPLWRHYEALNQVYEGRPATELVVRSIPSIAHYDYAIDWVFTLGGEIQVNIGATGIDAVKGATIQDMSEPGAVKATEYGALVAPGLVAIHHDHYFSIRLDFEIDGTANTFVRERVVPAALPEDSLRRSLWRLEEEPLRIEDALSARDGPQVWRIENPSVTTALGHHPGYQIQGSGPTSLLAPDDWPQRRAAFSAQNLWVTVRHDDELYAAGVYPNQSKGDDGLPAYTDGESTVGADLVVWYTLGFRHITRPEDWPILSTVWKGVKLRPYKFFTQNPALGVTPHFQQADR